jgi:hypothetical protein
VDWEAWSEDERRAALSHVLLPRGRCALLNAADFEDHGPSKPRELDLGRAHASAQDASRSAFGRRTLSLDAAVSLERRGCMKSVHGEVVEASYQGITAKLAG